MNVCIASFGSYLVESCLPSLLVTTDHIDGSTTSRRIETNIVYRKSRNEISIF